MNLEEIKELIRIFEQAAITELEIEERNFRVKLSKQYSLVPSSQPFPSQAGEVPITQISREQIAVETDKEISAVPEENYITITAPMVGTCYLSPAPGEPPFVEEGDVLEVEQTACIIEAMKLMNESETEVAGRVVKVLVEDATPVEYGQALFWIEPI